MKDLVSLGVVILVIAMTTLTPSGNQDRFVGAWRLVSLEEPTADGKVEKVECTGMLVFTRDGHMSVQVMYRNPQAGTNAAPVQYAQGGYEASFGRYQIDERAHTFTFHVEGALVRSLIGQDPDTRIRAVRHTAHGQAGQPK